MPSEKSPEETEQCPYCGSEYPHLEIDLNDEITVDITCQSVWFVHDELGEATVIDHDDFEAVVEQYKDVQIAMENIDGVREMFSGDISRFFAEQ